MENRKPGDRKGRMQADSAVVEEWPVWLEVNGEPAVTWMCTPDQLEELAVGWLHGEGYIGSIADLIQLRPCAPDLGFWADVKPEGVAQVKSENRKRVLASGCGAVTTMLADPPAPGAVPSRGEPPAAETLRTLFKQLFAAGTRYNETGGIHAAALTDGATLLFHAEDIGRHNAVDKVVGHMLLARRLPLDRHLLMVSGRASFEIMQKALTARIPVVAAVSAPSSMAVEMAIAADMTLVGFVRGGGFNVYAGAGRIALERVLGA